MSTALEAASLIMIPTSYSDGLLASVKPNDGAGDFTFSRGSNISATRVNADGYIEKGYENLLLQSNSFSTSPWGPVRASITSGQAGYDGSNDAWLLESTDGTLTSLVKQDINLTGVKTISIYAKSNTANWILLYAIGGSLDSWFDVQNGATGGKGSGAISSFIESVGNDWWRCSVTTSNSITDFRIYVTDANNSFNSVLGSSVYIQDAMLNQGMVAYPYVETTTAPVASGILEDTPRIDFSGGNQSLLLEPSRTNLWINSEYLSPAKAQNTGSSVIQNTTETLSPEGLYNASKFSGVGGFWLWRDFLAVQNVTSTISCYVKAVTSGVNNTFRLSIAGQSSADLTATDEWQRFSYTALGTAQATGLLRDSSGNDADLYIYGFQAEQDATYPTSYIPTYGVSQTRLADAANNAVANTSGNYWTLFIDYANFNNGGVSGDDSIIFKDSSNAVIFRLWGLNGFTIRSFSGDSNGRYYSSNQFGLEAKAIVRYDGTEIGLFLNGVKQTISSPSPLESSWNQLYKVDKLQAADNKYNFNQMLVFPTALSDEACIELTTI